ncbi:hypothetical protein [Burkholderia cepacia]|uniref:hypothetical protein n=1 Tax=Burkholderia cepacia TaxID=292 RepID=UPI002AB74788|nr:hypothetical protein [Burkholderia cepacia]
MTHPDCPIYKVSTPSSGGVLVLVLVLVQLLARCFGISGNGYKNSFFDLIEWGTKTWIPVS